MIWRFLTPTTWFLIGAFAFGNIVGGGIMGKLKDGRIHSLEAKYEKEKVDAARAVSREIARQSTLAAKADIAAGEHQEVVRARTITRVKEVQKYVAVNVASGVVSGSDLVPIGALSLLDAAASGGRPEDFTSGKSLDLASPVTFAQLVGNVVDNYGIAEGNSKQLEDLIRWEKESVKLSESRP